MVTISVDVHPATPLVATAPVRAVILASANNFLVIFVVSKARCARMLHVCPENVNDY